MNVIFYIALLIFSILNGLCSEDERLVFDKFDVSILMSSQGNVDMKFDEDVNHGDINYDVSIKAGIKSWRYKAGDLLGKYKLIIKEVNGKWGKDDKVIPKVGDEYLFYTQKNGKRLVALGDKVIHVPMALREFDSLINSEPLYEFGSIVDRTHIDTDVVGQLIAGRLFVGSKVSEISNLNFTAQDIADDKNVGLLGIKATASSMTSDMGVIDFEGFNYEASVILKYIASIPKEIYIDESFHYNGTLNSPGGFSAKVKAHNKYMISIMEVK